MKVIELKIVITVILMKSRNQAMADPRWSEIVRFWNAHYWAVGQKRGKCVQKNNTDYWTDISIDSAIESGKTKRCVVPCWNITKT